MGKKDKRKEEKKERKGSPDELRLITQTRKLLLQKMSSTFFTQDDPELGRANVVITVAPRFTGVASRLLLCANSPSARTTVGSDSCSYISEADDRPRIETKFLEYS